MFRVVRSVFSARPSYLGALLPLFAAGVLLTANSASAATKQPVKAQSTYRPAALLSQALPTVPELHPELHSEPTTDTTLADGVYFYGRSPERDQLGTEYIVFEVDQTRVVGAFYLPSSNFDCFEGELSADTLALSITDSYAQTAHAYDLAMEVAPSTVAGVGAGVFGPAGFHSLGQLTELEHELIATCQANYTDSI
ncbi:MAG: hypothetical protein AAFR15_15330 [Cyanobacteria bacterium J06627_15]